MSSVDREVREWPAHDNRIGLETVVRGDYLLADPIAQPSLLTNGAVRVRGGHVVEVGPFDQVLASVQPGSYVVKHFDLVLPGLINAHHHVRQPTPAQLGCPDDFLEPWLLGLSQLPSADARLATIVSSARLLRSGVTTVIHSEGPRTSDDAEAWLRERLSGYVASGQRVAFALGYADQNTWVYAPDNDFVAWLPAEFQAAARDYAVARARMVPAAYADLFARMQAWVRKNGRDRIRLLAGPMSPVWCSRASLEMMAEVCHLHSTGVHMHLLESIYQRHYAQTALGMNTVAYLRQVGLLTATTSVAHAVWVSAEEISMLAEAGTTVVHNPSSNLRLRSGIAPILAMLQAGVHVALGTDASALDDDDDLLQEARLAWKLHFRPGLNRGTLDTKSVLRMLYDGGSRAALLGDRIGQLKPGYQADLIGVSLGRMPASIRPHSDDLLPIALQRLRAADVEWVMVGGVEVVRNARCVAFDEAAVIAELTEQVASRLPAARLNSAVVERLRPFVEQYYEQQVPVVGLPFYAYNGN
jgi:5-methylthioadenosine/S-adenosylhomocysteine deaminase